MTQKTRRQTTTHRNTVMQKTIGMDRQRRGNTTNNDPCKHKREKNPSPSRFRSRRKLHPLEISKKTGNKTTKKKGTLYTLRNRRKGNHLQQRSSHPGNRPHRLTVQQ